MKVFIYALVCPVAEKIRYIGKSIAPEKRLRGHINSARTYGSKHHTAAWLRKLDGLGLAPSLQILEVVESGEDWRTRERSWISSSIAQGLPLTNTTIGGEGLDYIKQEDQERYRKNHQAAMSAYWATPKGQQQRKNVIAAALAPEALARRNAAKLVTQKAPAYRAKMKVVNSEIAARPEVKAKHSADSKRMWQDPAKRANFMEKFAGAECKMKQSESKIKAWADPEVGSKMRAVHASEESRKRKSEAAQRRNTPEYRALLSERLTAAWARRKAEKANVAAEHGATAC